MKRFIIISSIILLTCKAYSIPSKPCNHKPSCCKKPINNFAFSYTKKNETNCAKNTYLYADFIYMNAWQSIEYGYVIDHHLGSSSQKYNPGFRLGLNKLVFNDFYFDINWTYIKLKNDAEISYAGDSIIGALLPPDDLNVMPTASSRVKGNIDTLDIRLVKSFYINKHFISTPMMGIRVAWIDQNFLARYFINYVKNSVKYSKNYCGVGLSGSYDATLKLYKGAGIYANSIFSLLFGKFRISQDSITPSSALKYNTRESFYTVNSVAQISCGLIYEKLFNKNKCKIRAKAGYEFHYWWNQNRLKRFLDLNPVAIKPYSKDDLALNGFVFGLSVIF